MFENIGDGQGEQGAEAAAAADEEEEEEDDDMLKLALMKMVYKVTQKGIKGWPKKPFDISVGSVGVTIMDEKGKPITTLVYNTLKHWSFRKTQLAIELRARNVEKGHPSVYTLFTGASVRI